MTPYSPISRYIGTIDLSCYRFARRVLERLGRGPHGTAGTRIDGTGAGAGTARSYPDEDSRPRGPTGGSRWPIDLTGAQPGIWSESRPPAGRKRGARRVDALDDHDPTLLTHREHDDLDSRIVDVTDRGRLREAFGGYDVLVHLAAVPSPEPKGRR